MPPSHHSIFTGEMFFLMPSQQYQSTEDNRRLIFSLIIPALSLKNVNISQKIVAIYQQPLAGCKPQPIVNCKTSSMENSAKYYGSVQEIPQLAVRKSSKSHDLTISFHFLSKLSCLLFTYEILTLR